MRFGRGPVLVRCRCREEREILVADSRDFPLRHTALSRFAKRLGTFYEWRRNYAIDNRNRESTRFPTVDSSKRQAKFAFAEQENSLTPEPCLRPDEMRRQRGKILKSVEMPWLAAFVRPTEMTVQLHEQPAPSDLQNQPRNDEGQIRKKNRTGDRRRMRKCREIESNVHQFDSRRNWSLSAATALYQANRRFLFQTGRLATFDLPENRKRSVSIHPAQRQGALVILFSQSRPFPHRQGGQFVQLNYSYLPKRFNLHSNNNHRKLPIRELFEFLTQSLSGPVESGLNGGNGYGKFVGDFLIAPIMNIFKHENFPIF